MDDLRRICWDAAIHAFGTQKIFERRALYYDGSLKFLSFLGIAVPVFLGVDLFHGVAWVRAIADWGALLLLISAIFTLVYDWPGELAFARESAAENGRIASSYEALGRSPPNSVEELQDRLATLEAESRRRNDADSRHGLWGWEYRFGMRSALRQFSRPCAECRLVPRTMKSTECPVCGQFGITYRIPGRRTR